MANLSIRARLARLEADDGSIEILNPRTFEIADPVERAQAEEDNRRRVAAAMAEMARGGRRVITIPPARSYE